ncbi:MAG: MFS transporter [Patescibacteria group bacterium]|jgi:MFS family permease
MLQQLHVHLPHYFSKHVSRKFISLGWSVGFMDLGQAAVLIFEPVFLYTLWQSIVPVLVFYLAVYLVYLFVLPFTSRLLARLGLEHCIFYSHIFLVSYFICLYAGAQFPLLLFIAPLLLAAQKMLYWPAFHIDFMLFADRGQRGREVSTLLAISSIMYVIGPLVGGVVVAKLGFAALFLFVSVLFLLSAIPLLRIKEIHLIQHIPYRSFFSRLFHRGNRDQLYRYLGFGEELIVMFLWPIFIYLIIKDFAVIGSIAAGATLLTTLIVLVIGKKTDSLARKYVSRYGIFGYMVSWVVRAAATTSGFVFGLDVLSRLTKSMLFVPLMADMYDKSTDDEPVAIAIFFEQALSIGKVLAAAGALVCVLIFENPWLPIFALAGLFTLLYLRGSSRVAHAKP